MGFSYERYVLKVIYLNKIIVRYVLTQEIKKNNNDPKGIDEMTR